MKAPIYTGVLMIATAIGLGACSQETAEPVDAEAPAGIAGLEIADGRLVLPPVKGNPAAVYFNVTYSGDRNLAIRRADVAGAGSSEMHDTVEMDGKMTMQPSLPVVLNSGDTVEFAPGGKHIMAMDVSEDLTAGGTTEVTLTVAGGDKHSFDVPIRAAGEER